MHFRMELFHPVHLSLSRKCLNRLYLGIPIVVSPALVAHRNEHCGGDLLTSSSLRINIAPD